MNEYVRSLIADIVVHLNKIQRLKEEIDKRYGIGIIAVNADFGAPLIQVRRGFAELKEYLGDTSDIKGSQTHWNFYYGDIEICTVTNGGKRFLKAKKRNNKWTRGNEHAAD